MKRLLLFLLLLPVFAHSQTLPWAKLLDSEQSFARNDADKRIYNTIVLPFIYANLKDTAIMSSPPDPLYQDEADWRGLKHIIRKAFGRSYVEYNLLRARATWYELHYMWKEYTRAVFKLYEIRCPDFTNKQECQKVSMATTLVSLYINDQDRINQAIIWADTLMKATKWYKSDCIDTYAKLLYKAGRTPDAIKWQTEAVKLEPANKSHLATLRKMIKGAPIYGVMK